MSCFRCGKELPEGVVECEGDCVTATNENSQAYRELMELVKPETPVLCLQMNFKPDPAVVNSPEKLAEFNRALERFVTAVSLGFQNSGLNKFCKRVDE